MVEREKRYMNAYVVVNFTLALWIFCSIAMVNGNWEKTNFPVNVKALENETLILPCDMQEKDGYGGAVSKTVWWKDGRLIGDTHNTNNLALPERYILLQNNTLIITGLTPRDAGEYKCEIIRPDLAPVLQVHSIKVLTAPTVEAVPKTGILIVDLGQEVDISCESSGFPTPVIKWTFQGELIELLDHRKHLTFNASSYNVSGLYECVASNDIGPAATAAIRVIVHGPPQVKAERHWVHTGMGLRAKLVAWVNSAPAARGEWHHEGVPVHTSSRIVIYNAEDDSSVLMIRNVRATDLGTYTFRAQNKMGMATVSFKLSGVAAEAEFITDPKINNATKTSYNLKWQVFSYTSLIEFNLWFRPYKPKPEPTSDGVFIKDKDMSWTKLTIPVQDNDGPLHIGSYTIHGLKPDTVYEALITTRNKFGWSKPSIITHLATLSINDHHRHSVDLEDEHDQFRRQTQNNDEPSPTEVDSTTLSIERRYNFVKTEVIYGAGATRHNLKLHLATALLLYFALNL